MCHRLHNNIPFRWSTSICEHRCIRTHINSRLWYSSNRNQTEMEQVSVGIASNGSPEVAVAVVGDPELLHKKKSAIRLAGPAKLQVIADFDATLTKYWIDGRRGQSSHGLLQQGNPVYDVKRRELYEYYHPLEFNPTIPLDKKAKLMEEWWGKTHALLIEGGLTFDAIKNSVANATIAFREGVVELFEFLEENDVPVLIFSAGLADIIEEVLRQKLHKSFKNVKVVSNRMVFDQSGQLVSFKGKTIHVLNKNEHALDMAAPVHDHLGDPDEPIDDTASVKKRTNVLLLGDHIGDLGMSDGLNYETRISVGFLNDNVMNSLDSYREAFDVLYLNDAPMWEF
ncbi:Cytosolic 5'-nucleotidase 3 [Camellia lanceoleosa]|nr:Cytosolic 5'-nucleotidase 3 [Camellia lanceoleosa]